MSDDVVRDHIRAALAALVRAEETQLKAYEANREAVRASSAAAMRQVIDGFNALQQEVNHFPWKPGSTGVRCDLDVSEGELGTVARLLFDWHPELDLFEQRITVSTRHDGYEIEDARLGWGARPQIMVAASAEEVLLTATKAAAHWIALRGAST